jgi:hypothetical protein
LCWQLFSTKDMVVMCKKIQEALLWVHLGLYSMGMCVCARRVTGTSERGHIWFDLPSEPLVDSPTGRCSSCTTSSYC